MKNKIVSGFFWKFNEQIASQIVTFVLSIILARILSPKDYGIVALVNVFITIANVFVVSGFGTSLIQKKHTTELEFSTIFWMSEIMSCIIYLILFFIAPYIARFYNNSDLTLILRIFALELPISAFNSIQEAYISKKLLFKKVFISTTIAAILSGIIGIVLAYNGFGVWSLIGQYLSNTIIISIVLFSEIKWYPKLIFSWISGKPLLDFGWKILATSLLATFFNQLRSLILGKVYSVSDLAYYNRGQRFPELISENVNGSISSVLFPALSNYGGDKKKIKQGLRLSIRISTFVLMPLMFGMMATSKQIIILLLGNKWMLAIPFMEILCMSCVFDSVSNENLQAIKAIGRSDVLLKLELIKKPLYLALLLVGMNINVLAMAYTMAIYNIIAVMINMKPNRNLLAYSIKEQFQDIVPALLDSIIMFWVVKFIGNALTFPNIIVLFIQVLCGILIYIFFAIVFKMDAMRYVKNTIFNKVIRKK